MNAFSKRSLIAIIACASLSVLTVYAADPAGPPAKSATPTKEQREKMAVAHEKMAACLRSDRDVSDCRHEMMEQCKEMQGGECEHMDHHMHHGHDHDEHHPSHEHSSSTASKAK
jgi:hypothetical protein